MRNIVLTRVDERLIHGQVMTSWLKLCNANVIVIIDAASATNAFLKRILFAAKVPQPLLQMVKSGVAIPEIILGNMGGAPGRKRFNKSISASPEEIQTFKDLIDQGVNVYCQMVPSDSKEDVKKLLK